MEKVKFAVVGCGRISSVHIAGILNTPIAELTAVCDTDEHAARQACIQGKINNYYVSFDEMLEKEKIDVLCICTPSGLHGGMAIKAMKKGINVLCEKPLDIKYEVLDEMVRVQKENKVILGGIFQRRNAEAMKVLKEKYDNKAFGDVIFLSATMNYYRSDAYYESGAWRGTKKLDGGCLMNQCIHGIDALIYLAGDAESVFAKCEKRKKKIECEDTAAAIIKFKNGAMGIVQATTCVEPAQDTIISVNGTSGSASVGDGGIYVWDFADKCVAPDIGKESMGGANCGWNEGNLHTIQIENMANAVLNREKIMIEGEDARRAVDLILAMYESAETGKEVYLQK